MPGNYFNSDRAAHWIKLNHQCRIPKRWVFFDTESQSERINGDEVQSYRIGGAIRWRHGLKRGDYAESLVSAMPSDLWSWVDNFCVREQRTVVFAHNLGHDARIGQVFDILPSLGWQLEWCNLDRNVSAMKWVSDHGTLIFADTWTWLPMDLRTLAPTVGLRKLIMPPTNAKLARWEKYLMRDVEIGYRVVRELVDYIASEDLGNWQPTGAGMAYATWRHKFLSHKVLVHDDEDAIAAERAAMHTGRAEAWRHGEIKDGRYTEVDLRNAYIRICADTELPCKLRMHTGTLAISQYQKLSHSSRLLCKALVETSQPVVPTQAEGRTLWPIGRFETWLWDAEIDLLLEEGQYVKIKECYVYTRSPILQDWARWVLAMLAPPNEDVSPVVRTWLKHCSRALIGRIALRTPSWEQFGENPSGETGISYMQDTDTGITHRLMHVGDRTLIETERREGRDSLPQVTGYIMSVCRARLWAAMRAAELPNLAHVDTDSMILSQAGLQALRAALGPSLERDWQIKGTWRRLIVYGPRNYRCADLRKVSGVPRKATEILPNVFTGEQWHGLATDIENGRSNAVTISQGKWVMTQSDPRRMSSPGVATGTEPYVVGVSSVAASESVSISGRGA